MTGPLDSKAFIESCLACLKGNGEMGARERSSRGRSWEGGRPDRVRNVAVVGGGSAGYMTAIALAKRLPGVAVTLIESPDVPIIGVGEATVDSIVPFLHGYLGLDIHEFYDEVRPTWKLGIRFEWGDPGRECFQAPFDWGTNNIGLAGALHHEGSMDSWTLQSALMARNRTPILRTREAEYVSLLGAGNFAYHLDNRPLVLYLQRAASSAGVRHLPCTIREVILDDGGECVAALVDEGGQRLEFDFYVDCTGFRSLLLGEALGSDFVDFSSSLFTDSAVIFTVPHHGHVKSYSTARTMEHGWCWIIPQMQEDHCGYVYSSAFCDQDRAVEEARVAFPGMSDPKLVRFRSGRRAHLWKGNVAAVGNSYGFVEPLESTGIFMICRHILAVVEHLADECSGPSFESLLNQRFGSEWDSLRWFLAVHYKYNRRLDSPFWRAARNDTDISGLSLAMDMFHEGAPLAQRSAQARAMISAQAAPFFGLPGLDCLLLGQQVEARVMTPPPHDEAWHSRRLAADALVSMATPAEEALRVVRECPEFLTGLLSDGDSWCSPLMTRWAAP